MQVQTLPRMKLDPLILRMVRDTATRERSSVRRERNASEFVSVWSEEESLDGSPTKALVIILATRGCAWAVRSGCSMCGYTNESAATATDADIWAQYSSAMERLKGEKVVKIYTSGSFLDTFELSRGLQRRILEDLVARVERVVVETRHELINEENLERLTPFRSKLMLAIGVESSNDRVLNYSVNKPSRFSNFLNAASLARSHGFYLKAYVMLKTPFMSEKDAIADCARTVQDVGPHVETVSINPSNVQRSTVMELLWNRGNYRPPWLWSLVEVLKGASGLGCRVMSKPTGAGTLRGAHNCGTCDEAILEAVGKFSQSGDYSLLDHLDCGCRDVWKKELSFGSFPVPYMEKDYRRRGSVNAEI